MDEYKMDNWLELQKKIEELSTAFKKIALDLDKVPDFVYNISEMKNKELRKEIGYIGVDMCDSYDEKIYGKNEVLHSRDIIQSCCFNTKQRSEAIIEYNLQLMDRVEAEAWLSHFPKDEYKAMVVSFDQDYQIFVEHYSFDPDHKYVYAEDA